MRPKWLELVLWTFCQCQKRDEALIPSLYVPNATILLTRSEENTINSEGGHQIPPCFTTITFCYDEHCKFNQSKCVLWAVTGIRSSAHYTIWKLSVTSCSHVSLVLHILERQAKADNASHPFMILLMICLLWAQAGWRQVFVFRGENRRAFCTRSNGPETFHT